MSLYHHYESGLTYSNYKRDDKHYYGNVGKTVKLNWDMDDRQFDAHLTDLFTQITNLDRIYLNFTAHRCIDPNFASRDFEFKNAIAQFSPNAANCVEISTHQYPCELSPDDFERYKRAEARRCAVM